jgi:nucleoside-diphosphate-sugar epimerase
MNRVLLLGASGFLGGHVHRALLEQPRIGHVACPGRERCDLVTATIEQITDLLREEQPTTVVNCTGLLDGTASALVLANTLVTAKLIDAVAAAGSGTGTGIRLIRLGSAGEYGQVPFRRAVAETDPARPASVYGLSHLAATRMVYMAATTGRVDGVTLRVFNPIGTGSGEASVLGRAAVQLRTAMTRGRASVTLGPLSAYRDFVDARDVGTAVVAATLVPALPSRVLNIGSGRSVTARAAVHALARLAGFTGDIKENGQGADRSASVSWMCADITRATATLGWRPVYDLNDSLKALWTGLTGA